MKLNVNKIVKMGMLCALSVVLMYLIRFSIFPAAPYLEYEPADVPILIGAFMFGPVAGLILTFIIAFLQAITVSTSSGILGFAMHVLATGTFALTAGLTVLSFLPNYFMVGTEPLERIQFLRLIIMIIITVVLLLIII